MNYDYLTVNGTLQATGGYLNANSGILTIDETSKISKETVTVLDKITLRITGGEVSLNELDSWASESTINLSSGTLNYDSIETNGTLETTGGNLNINSGKLTIDENSNIASAVTTKLGSATCKLQ